MALASLAALKAYLSIDASNTASDVVLQRLLASADAWFRSQIGGRELEAANYHEHILCQRSGIVVLPYYPIISVTSVSVDGTAIVAADPGSDTGYWLDTKAGFLRSNEIWINDYAAVTWRAGYEQIPADVTGAVIELAGTRFRDRSHLGVVSSGAVGESQTYTQWAASAYVLRTIDAYR